MRSTLLVFLLVILIVGCSSAVPKQQGAETNPAGKEPPSIAGAPPVAAGGNAGDLPPDRSASDVMELQPENYRQVHFLRHADSAWQIGGDLVWTAFSSDVGRAYISTTLSNDLYFCPKETGHLKITEVKGKRIRVRSADGVMAWFSIDTHEWSFDT